MDRQSELVANGSITRLELYVRSLGPPIGARRQQETVVERLEALEDDRTLDVTVDVWGRRICPNGKVAGTVVGESILDTIGRLRDWARERDVSLDPFFGEREVRSTVTGERYDTIVPPRVCLAAFTDDGVETVVPCEMDGECVAVSEYLDAVTGAAEADRSRASNASDT